MPVRTSNCMPISLKKANVPGQDTEAPPVTIIDNFDFDADCQFTYLDSTITDNLLWTQRSTSGLGRQLQFSLISRLECAQAPRCRRIQKWQSAIAMPVLSAHCSRAGRHGLHYAGQERRLKTFHLRIISAVFWAYPGNIKDPPLMSCLDLVFPLRVLCLDNADC